MDFKQKFKSRLYIAIIYTAVGVMMIAGANVAKTENAFISSFGLALVVMGIVRIRNYFIITRDEESIKKQIIAETDERNISIVNKARSITFTIYVLFSGTAVMVLSLFNMHDAAQWMAYSIVLLVAIYWIVYWIIRKNS